MIGLLLRLVATTIDVLAASALLAPDYFDVPDLTVAIVFALVLGLLNAVVRPILAIMTFPLHILTFGLFSLVLNAIMLGIAAALVPGVHIGGVIGAFLAALLISIVSTIDNCIIP